MALVLTDSHGKYFQQHFVSNDIGIVCEFESGIKIEEIFPRFGHLICGFKVCTKGVSNFLQTFTNPTMFAVDELWETRWWVGSWLKSEHYWNL